MLTPSTMKFIASLRLVLVAVVASCPAQLSTFTLMQFSQTRIYSHFTDEKTEAS